MADLKYVTFASQIELPFYSSLFSSKLDVDKLDDSTRSVLGVYEPQPQSEPGDDAKMQILGNALSGQDVRLGQYRAEGQIKNVNTIEDFKQMDKPAMLKRAGQQIWDAIKDGTIYSIPSLLSSFTILSYADLKKYRFTYWFGFPAIHSSPVWRRSGLIEKLKADETEYLVDVVRTWQYLSDNRQRGFFLAKKVRKPVTTDERPISAGGEPPEPPEPTSLDTIGYTWVVNKLGSFGEGFFDDVDEADQYVAFADPSTYPEHPGWPLRNLLILVRQLFRKTKVQIICYRDVQHLRHESRSIILPLVMDEVEEMTVNTMPRVTGWERNFSGALQPRIANLGEHMDPTKLADSAVDLNLKLMKWRISPNLNLDAINSTSCLLLGAGTLGSYVSRNLMGWGVRKITFVDYGTVSFSNPVRQPLFEFKDCLQGGAPKAKRAAEALREIYPGVDSEGHVLSVPMLGHPSTDLVKTKADFEKLKALIDAHDVIFLLMDSRESRWLPTVMGKAAGKTVMNAALGFDTYVVMRHGARPETAEKKTLGCYFCSDVVVAGDSQKDQTLDQQCTVTRPGVAAIASALLVELLASVLQHPLKQHAPAPSLPASSEGSYARDPPDHPLGIIPHQIRGFLHTFQNVVIRGESFDCCSACSEPILQAYEREGWEFVKRALEEREYVAELSGLAEVQRRAEAALADMEISDEEEGEGIDGEPVLL